LTICYGKDSVSRHFLGKKPVGNIRLGGKSDFCRPPVDVAGGSICDYSPPPVAGATTIHKVFWHS
jgi:hypothetical protein